MLTQDPISAMVHAPLRTSPPSMRPGRCGNPEERLELVSSARDLVTGGIEHPALEAPLADVEQAHVVLRPQPRDSQGPITRIGVSRDKGLVVHHANRKHSSRNRDK
jgi:hypothetical protein